MGSPGLVDQRPILKPHIYNFNASALHLGLIDEIDYSTVTYADMILCVQEPRFTGGATEGGFVL